MSPRWTKMLRDAKHSRGRLLMICAALAASICAVVTMLGAYTILAREVPRNYNGTNPASAQLETEGAIDAALLGKIAQRPNIAAAELAAVASARVEVAPGKRLPMRIFVIPDFAQLRINTLGFESGTWPPLPGTLAIERSALALSGGAVGQALPLDLPKAGRRSVKLAAVVHDPGLAPAWQENALYGYATPETMAALGEPVTLNLLKIVVAQGAGDATAIERTARELAQWLATQGVEVHEARIPPPMRHPHQGQMDAVVLMLLAFSLLVLLLGGVLTAAIIGGLLSEQVRQVAIMKAVGAQQHQVAGMYLVLTCALACVALLVALPAGVASARALVGLVAGMLNLRIDSMALPWTMFAQAIALGLAVPMLAALAPIAGATRTTVQSAMQDHNLSRNPAGARWAARFSARDPAFTLAVRNMLRRRSRFLLTVLLLAGAGAMFMAGMNLRAAWENNVAQAAADRRFDLELRLQDSAPAGRVTAIVGALQGVRRVEDWSSAPAALAGDGGLEISRRYPDGGHGSFSLRAAPADTTLVANTMRAGRWLRAGDTRAAVINTQALTTNFPGAQVGSTVTIKVEGRSAQYEVAGIVSEILAPGAVYVTPEAYAAATGSGGQVNTVRIALADRAQAVQTGQLASAALAKDGIVVRSVRTDKSFSASQGSHIYILVWALGFVAATMALVGMLGLASSLGASVVERTREFGIMRSLGASSGAVVRSVLYEGALTAFAGSMLAIALSMLPSTVVGRILASVSSQELALRLAPSAALMWMAGALLAALAVSYFPATRASKLTIKQTLEWEYA